MTEQSQIWVLREIEYHCKLYLKLNTSMKAVIENIIDNNDLHFDEWEEDVQEIFKRQYHKMNLDKMMTDEKSLSYLTPQSALRKVTSEKHYYKNCIFNADYNYKELQMSDMNSDNSFKLNFKMMYNHFKEMQKNLSKVYYRKRCVHIILSQQKILKLKSVEQSAAVRSEQITDTRAKSENVAINNWTLINKSVQKKSD